MDSEYQGKAEKILRDLGKKIDELINKSFQEKGELKEDINSRIEELKRDKEKLEKEMKDFVSRNEGKWKEVEVYLKRAAEELKKALDVVFQNKTT
ncbi:MAG: hypothetical protein M3421_15185 [Bacteroidota bacterium]|nr:hypothetical protein [Bacteroidota bacterium]